MSSNNNSEQYKKSKLNIILRNDPIIFELICWDEGKENIIHAIINIINLALVKNSMVYILALLIEKFSMFFINADACVILSERNNAQPIDTTVNVYICFNNFGT